MSRFLAPVGGVVLFAVGDRPSPWRLTVRGIPRATAPRPRTPPARGILRSPTQLIGTGTTAGFGMTRWERDRIPRGGGQAVGWHWRPLRSRSSIRR